MNRAFSITFVAALTLSSSLMAGQMSYTGSTSGDWVNPVGGTSKGAGTSSFEFGGYNGSTLSFYAKSSFSTTSGTPFELGKVTLSNGSPVNTPSSVTFAATLNFTTPTGLGKQTFDFAAGITTEGRDTIGEFSVSFNQGGKYTVTGSNGTTYTLELLGLTDSSHWGGSVFSSLTSCPADSSSGYLWAEITQSCPQVPEPTGLVLAALGLGIAGAMRLRNRLRMRAVVEPASA